jgi:small subunit ribosomal protein S20
LANIPSQIKRNRQNEKRRLRNRDARGIARSAVKNALAQIEAGEDSQASVASAIKALDKAARKGAIHHRNAARRKSRLVKRLGALGQRAAAEPEASTRVAEPESKTKGKAKTPASSESKPKKRVAKKATRKSAAKKSTKK